jgi:hypothetical protein
MNRILVCLTFAVVPVLGSCAHRAQQAPSLSAAPATSPYIAPASSEPEQKGFFSRTADATWNVVSAPVKLIAPGKPVPPKEPVTYDAPDTVIMMPVQDDAPAATQP